MPGTDAQQHNYKIIVVGEASVGKTSLVKRYTENVYSNKYRYTIGVDFALKIVEWDNNTTLKLQIWDIAGQERFGTMTHVYYKEASGACLVFDISSAKSFQAAYRWKQDINAKVTLPSGQPVPTVLLANKCDLEPSEHQVSDAEIERFCSESGCVGWLKTSAKDNINVEKAMKLLLTSVVALPAPAAAESKPDTVELSYNPPLTTEKQQSETSKRCC